MNFTEIADKALSEFGKNKLKPNEKEMTEGNKIMQEIFEKLKQKSRRFPAARTFPAGSMGKATAIPGYDYDIVVFINDQSPPFKSVLDDYEDILLMTNRPKITNLKKTKHSLQFQVNGIDFDLLPAENFVKTTELGGEKLAEQQAKQTLQKIQEKYRTNPDIVYDYSSSLAEAHVRFMRRQSAFIHELVRLCKFWNKTLVIDPYVSGRSTIIELVATYAGQLEENNQSSPSTLRAFVSFLKQMRSLDTMAIKFEAENSLTCKTPSFKKPFLVEHSNPFNNMLDGIDRVAVNKFKEFAVETLRRLDVEVKKWSLLGHFPLDVLFEAQPRVLHLPAGAIPTRRLVDIGYDSSRKNPNMIVRNEKKFRGEILTMQRTLKNTLFTAVHALTSSAGESGISDFDVQKLAIGQIAHHAFGRESLDWTFGSAASERHEDHDVTFEIPFADAPKMIVVSFSWN